MPDRLSVANFAQIDLAQIEFGDLTVLVGPQGSGKSLVLQLFKLALDSDGLVKVMRDAGHPVDKPEDLLDVYFGQGMASAWRSETRVAWNGSALDPGKLARKRSLITRPDRVFFIPAHRAMLVAEGWPAPFQRLTVETPTVARLFSENLFHLFSNPRDSELFPVERRLKKAYRERIDAALFHSGRVRLEHEGLRKRLELRFGETRLPFMTWTAGQREFTPLLLGLYHLLPSRAQSKREGIEWVVIEEPEMGLHPDGLAVVLLLVLDLLWRGYRVVLATHAPVVLDMIFAIRLLKEERGKPSSLAKALGVDPQQTSSVMKAALERDYRTWSLQFSKEGTVTAKDISNLDPNSDDADEATWGGLTRFPTRFNDIIMEAVNAAK